MMLLGCSLKEPVPLLSTQETPPQATLEENTTANTTQTQSPASSEPISLPTSTTAPIVTPMPTGPYTGPLFDAHLHLQNMYYGTSEQLSSMKLRSAADLLSYLDRNNVIGAIGFYIFPSSRARYNWVSSVETVISGSKGRVVPLLLPTPWSEFVSGQFSDAVLRQYLQPQGLFQGVGEIVLTQPELQNITFDSPQMQTVFKVVNEMKGIVMVHPSSGPGVRPTDLAEIEPSIQKYPDAIFLFHPKYCFDAVAPLMLKYPNVYFSMDFSSFTPGFRMLYPTDPSLSNVESFLASVESRGIDKIVEENINTLSPQILQCPDRIMWGTDFAGNTNLSWHFEDSVTDKVIEISRQFIGRLPADVQEKYAYKNAQRVFGRFLTPNP